MVEKVPVAFLAGLLSVITPCVLPLVPGYLSAISGVDPDELERGSAGRRVVIASIPFILGFTLVFVVVGAGAAAISNVVTPSAQADVAGFVLVVLGLAFVGLLPVPERVIAPGLLVGARKRGSRALLGGAFAVCAAVVRRLRTGEGERIDVAMADVLATWTGAATPRARGVDPSARGVPGYGTFETEAGGHLTLGVLTEDHFWRSLCDVLGLADTRDLAFTERMARLAELQARIADAIRHRPRDGLLEELLAADVPAAPVLDRSEMLRLSHFHERSVVTADPWADPATGYPIRFEQRPAARTAPPPKLDEHRGATFLPRA